MNKSLLEIHTPRGMLAFESPIDIFWKHTVKFQAETSTDMKTIYLVSPECNTSSVQIF